MALAPVRAFWRQAVEVSYLRINRKMLVALVHNDLKEQYLGSYLGMFWALLRPLSFMLVIWAVFTYGLRVMPADDSLPFAVWLLSGMVPWLFFADGLRKGTNAVVGNAYLVKKVAFPVAVLPVVKVLSALVLHCLLLLVLLAVVLISGGVPTLYWLQLPYYVGCIVVLLLGLGWLTSAVRVFVKDIAEVVALVVQFGFWLTPVFWPLQRLSQDMQWLAKLNPVAYVVQGFRDSLAGQLWFWQRPWETLYFMSFAMVLLVVGLMIFRHTRPHFLDVL